MRHFIAYHNTEKMGRSLSDGQPLGLVTNKPVKHLLHNLVWFVTGEGLKPRKFSLGSVFQVSEIGDTEQDGFKRFASGAGHVFEPPIPINDMDWFSEVLRATGHFGLGVQEMKDEAVIGGLKELAARVGYIVAEDAMNQGQSEAEARRYPDPKQRDLSDEEKQQLRERIELGSSDIHVLAAEFDCTSSQVAGIKAAMYR